jgi:hypothetical protein
MKMEQTMSVQKRWHINFRRRGITQKKTYNKLETTSTDLADICAEMDERRRKILFLKLKLPSGLYEQISKT